jgi:hypothetical protein
VARRTRSTTGDELGRGQAFAVRGQVGYDREGGVGSSGSTTVLDRHAAHAVLWTRRLGRNYKAR